jgi:thioredoxin 1
MKDIVSKEDFIKAIKNGVTVIDFNTPWCTPCHAQEPILLRLAKRYAKDAFFATMNVDQNREIAIQFGIQSVPTLIFFKNGKEIQRLVGLQSEKVLSNTVRKLLCGSEAHF